MTLRQNILFLLTPFLLSCRPDTSSDLGQKSDAVLQTIKSYALDNKNFLDTLDCQANLNKDAVKYRDFAKNLNSVVTRFTNPAINGSAVTDEQSSKMLQDLNGRYRQIIDSTLKSFDFSLFPEKDLAILTSVKFAPVIAKGTDKSLNYYYICQHVLLQHSDILKLNKSSLSHGDCFTKTNGQ